MARTFYYKNSGAVCFDTSESIYYSSFSLLYPPETNSTSRKFTTPLASTSSKISSEYSLAPCASSCSDENRECRIKVAVVSSLSAEAEIKQKEILTVRSVVRIHSCHKREHSRGRPTSLALYNLIIRPCGVYVKGRAYAYFGLGGCLSNSGGLEVPN